MTIRLTATFAPLLFLALLPTTRAQVELYTWVPSQPGSHFGQRLAEVGDVDLDGTLDILVGSPSEVSGQGTLRVYSGRTGALLRTYAGGALEHLGFRVANGGDIDDDGWDDMLVSASPLSFSGPQDAHVRI